MDGLSAGVARCDRASIEDIVELLVVAERPNAWVFPKYHGPQMLA